MLRHSFVLTAVALLFVTSAQAQTYQRTTAEQQKALMQYRAGWDLMRAENFEEAAARFKAATQLDPNMALAYYGLGRADVARRRFVEAIEAYTNCRRLYVTRANQQYTAAADATRAREDELMELRELQRQNSSGPQTQTKDNNQRLIQNRMRLVQENLDRGRNVDIDLAVPAFISLALGSAYFRAQHFDDAEREFKAAIHADRTVGEAHNNLAVVYMLTGRLADAESEIKLAEKNGFEVHRDLKHELAERRKQ
jgi:tetratricopeptide (TPR) repeat protein